MSTEFQENTQCADDVIDPKDNNTSVYGSSDQLSLLNRLRDNQTYAVLDLPSCLKDEHEGGRETSLNSLELKIRSFPIPSITIDYERIGYGTGSFIQSTDRLSDPESVTISFSLDDRLLNYNTLYKWMNMIIDFKKGAKTEYCKSQYSTVFHSFIINQKKRPVGAFTFHGVVPQNIGGFNLDNTSVGEDIFVDFTFDYDYLTFDLRDGETLHDTYF